MDKNLPTRDQLPQQRLPIFAEPAISPSADRLDSFKSFLRIVIKHRYVVSICVGLTTLLSLIFAFTTTPRYSAQSRIRISTYQPVLAAAKIEDMLQERSKEASYLETQVQEISSFSLADKVLEDVEIREQLFTKRESGFLSSMFGDREEKLEQVDPVAGYKNPVSQIRSYLKLIEVRPVRRTSLVEIRATARSPALSAQIANRHAAAYIDWVRESRIEQQSRGLKFLRTQADELREKVVDLEREIADYAENNSIVAVNKDENIVIQKMSDLNKLLTQAIARRIEAEHLYREAKESLGTYSAGFDDPSTQTMRAELAKLQGEYSQLSAKFTDSYPKIQQLKSQIEGLKQTIEGQRGQIVMGLKAKALAASEEEKNLRDELEKMKSQAFELSKKQVQYNVLNRELSTSRELLENVLKQIKEMSLAVENNASNVSVVDLAVTPMNPSYPRKSLILLLGVFLGVLGGLGIALLLSYFDNSVRTPEDIATLLGIPALGIVPSFDLEEEKSLKLIRGGKPTLPEKIENLPPQNGDTEAALPIAYVANPKSLASEAYRTIRTGILLSQAGEPPRTILVSSAQSSEGKTTSIINLAASLASAGGRVILLEADLRRPSVHKHLKLEMSNRGLVEFLTSQATLEEVIIPDVIKRVSVILSGSIPPNPAELLGSLEMASLIDRLASEYDYLLLDSPPVLPVTDAVILSRYVDGVVLVVRGASTPRKVVVDAKARLQAVGARFLGAILNDVNIRGGDYYYYNRYYYSYYRSQPEEKVSKARA